MKDKERGASVVELAFIIPVLMLAIAATLDLATWFAAQQCAEAAAWEGATWAQSKQGADEAGIAGHILAAYPDLAEAGQVKVEKVGAKDTTYTHNAYTGTGERQQRSGSHVQQDQVRVTVSIDVPWPTPIACALLGQTGHVSASHVTWVDRTRGQTW